MPAPAAFRSRLTPIAARLSPALAAVAAFRLVANGGRRVRTLGADLGLRRRGAGAGLRAPLLPAQRRFIASGEENGGHPSSRLVGRQRSVTPVLAERGPCPQAGGLGGAQQTCCPQLSLTTCRRPPACPAAPWITAVPPPRAGFADSGPLSSLKVPSASLFETCFQRLVPKTGAPRATPRVSFARSPNLALLARLSKA